MAWLAIWRDDDEQVERATNHGCFRQEQQIDSFTLKR